MSKALIILLAICGILITYSTVLAISDGAAKLRDLNSLSEFAPPETFLNGNFIADEIEPQFVFGKVKDFWKSRSCPAAWLIEDGQKERIKNRKNPSDPFEYTLYLEEDCPGKVVYFIFVDRSQCKGDQWMEWREIFHKSKAQEEYGAVGTLLQKAAQNGFHVDAELRFIEIGGNLISKKPEDFLTGDLKVSPIYDLEQGKPVAK